MRKILKIAIFISTFFIRVLAQAQSVNIENFITVGVRNQGEIVFENTVKGYYTFYWLENIDKQTSNYMLKIFDENLKEILSEKFTDSKSLVLNEAAFNGQTMLFKFTDRNTNDRIPKFYLYDGKFKSIQRFSTGKEGLYYPNIAGPEEINKTLYPISNKGFLNYSLIQKSNKNGFEMVFTNSNGEKQWSYTPDIEKWSKKVPNLLTVGRNNFYNLLTDYESFGYNNFYAGSHITQYIYITDIATGKEVNEVKLADEQYKYQIFMAEEVSDKELTISGLYFSSKSKLDKSEALGLFTGTIDKNGQFINKKHLNIYEDIASYTPKEIIEKNEKIEHLFLHNIIRTTDNKQFAIFETYRMPVNAGKIALKILAGNGMGSVYELITEDLLIMEINDTFKIENIKFVDKSKTKISLPNTYGNLSANKVAILTKNSGLFDYLFTQLNPDKTGFMIAYKDIDKNIDEKEYNFEAILYLNNSYSIDKFNLKTPTMTMLPKPAKFGHVLITGYDKKAKKMELRLEKINY